MKYRSLAIAVGLSAFVASAAPPFLAQERVDADINAKIRKEAQDNSKILRTMHYLTDVYGPRVTGSPNIKAASDWAVTQLATWGLKNAHLEPWDFGHPGWTNQHASAHIVVPVSDALVAEVIAWTPGTNGVLRAAVVQVVPPTDPTKEAFAAWIDTIRDRYRAESCWSGRARPCP